ncbi:Ima1 N-terminal domain-containing protein [Xylogone sp. PMI_703]|nr:Ima1 N-terminal domain-containing protein [Xylogone sp. PMI_703]
MAPLRGRTTMRCFYCNQKSHIKYSPSISEWKCDRCDAVNYLDENGEITDPPIDTVYASNSQHYAFPRPASPSPGPETNLFCARCLKNQHLYTASLAQYDVETDPSHPDYKALERKYFAFRRDLERRYPQVCEDCEPKVLERMREAGKAAKSDYLRRLMDRSRENRQNHRAKGLNLDSSLNIVGQTLFYLGLAGQVVWNTRTLVMAANLNPALAVNTWPVVDKLPSLPIALKIRFLAMDWGQLVRSSLLCSICAIWWNPMFKQMNKGFVNHVKGFDDWYKYQSILLIARAMFFWLMGTGIFIDASSNESVGAHAFMLGFLIFITIASRYSLKVDLTPLWSSTPAKLPNVGPGAASGDRPMGSIADVLDEIMTTSSHKENNDDFLGDIDNIHPAKMPQNPSRFTSDLTRFSPPLVADDNFQETARQSRRPMQMNEKESAHYLETGELPPRLRRTGPDTATRRDENEMDWAPLNSEHRAFNPTRSALRATEGFSQAPVGDQGSQFWYKVPPAPKPAAHKLWNPSLKPRLNAPSPETKENFFNSMTRKTQMAETYETRGNRKEKREFEFAQQKFFPPQAQNESDLGLENLMSSFSLSQDQPKSEVQRKQRPKTEIHHLFQAILLATALWFWNSASKTPSENSKNFLLGSMMAGVGVSLRTILDNTVFKGRNRKGSVWSTFWVCLSIVEIGFATVGIWEILAGNLYDPTWSSLGNVLIGTMFVQEIWVAAFPH